jgi:hypothetical protein
MTIPNNVCILPSFSWSLISATGVFYNYGRASGGWRGAFHFRFRLLLALMNVSSSVTKSPLGQEREAKRINNEMDAQIELEKSEHRRRRPDIRTILVTPGYEPSPGESLDAPLNHCCLST